MTRPLSSTVAAYGLVLAGFAVLLASPPFLLTGLFAPPMLWIGVGIVGASTVWFALARGLYRGDPRAWYGVALLTAPALVLAWVMSRVGSPALSTLAAVLAADHLAVLFLFWRRSARL